MIPVYGAIIRHKLRTARGLLRHFWPTLLGLLLGVVFLGYRLFIVAMGGGIGNALEPQSIFYLHCACILLNGYRVLLKKNPVIRVNAATLHFLYNTPCYQKIIAAEYIWSLLKNMLAAMLLAALIHGFRYDILFFRDFLLLSGYLYSGILLSWISYHGEGKPRRAAIAGYFLSSIGLAVNIGAVRFTLIGCVAAWAVYYAFFGTMRYNMIKFRRDIAFIDENTSSASRYDLVKMSQITAEYNANRDRRFLLYHLPINKHNAILFKCLIETIRAGNRIWIILLSLLLAGTVVTRTTIFAGIPIIGDPAMAPAIGVLLIMTVYANVGEMLKKHMNTLLEKHRQGLFLPVGTKRVLSSYILMGGMIHLALTALVGLLMASRGYFLLLFYALYSIAFAFDIFIEANTYRLKQFIQTVIRILSVMAGFLFVA